MTEHFEEPKGVDGHGPLHGIKVVECTTTWSGPMAGCILADLGADVLRIEHPDGEVTRSAQPVYPGSKTSILHNSVNRNKRCLALDLHQEEGQAIARRLIGESDVLIENFRPGTMASWNLDYQRLAELAPQLIYVSISGFGQFGPLRALLGYDPLVQMMSGWASLNGPQSDRPLKAPTILGDDLAGLHAAIGCLGALQHRNRTGEGQHVDVAMLDCILFQSNINLVLGSMGAQLANSGNEFANVVPANLYSSSDGHVFIAVLLDKHWIILRDLMRKEGIHVDSRFDKRQARIENREKINSIVSAWCKNRSTDDLQTKLQHAGVPAAPLMTFNQIANTEHVAIRGMIQDSKPDDVPFAPVVGPAVKFSKTPAKIRKAAPALGADTIETLLGLGMQQDEIDRLLARRTVRAKESGA